MDVCRIFDGLPPKVPKTIRRKKKKAVKADDKEEEEEWEDFTGQRIVFVLGKSYSTRVRRLVWQTHVRNGLRKVALYYISICGIYAIINVTYDSIIAFHATIKLALTLTSVTSGSWRKLVLAHTSLTVTLT